MNTSHPPRAARFLLERLAPPNESLIGDLAEAYREGRSDLWYWRQVIAAVVAAFTSEIRAHPCGSQTSVTITSHAVPRWDQLSWRVALAGSWRDRNGRQQQRDRRSKFYRV